MSRIGITKWYVCKYFSQCEKEYGNDFVCTSCYRFETRKNNEED